MVAGPGVDMEVGPNKVGIVLKSMTFKCLWENAQKQAFKAWDFYLFICFYVGILENHTKKLQAQFSSRDYQGLKMKALLFYFISSSD